MNISLLENFINNLNSKEGNPNEQFQITHTTAASAAYDLSFAFNSTDTQAFKSTLSQYTYALSEAKDIIPNVRNSAVFEIGRIAGLCEAYSEMYQIRHKNDTMEEELKESVLSLRNASKSILRTLFIHSHKNEWISHSTLANECNQTPSALSNNIKRLISMGAVEATKEGRNVLYHLSSLCEQFLEKHSELLSIEIQVPQKVSSRALDISSIQTIPYLLKSNLLSLFNFYSKLAAPDLIEMNITPYNSIQHSDPTEYNQLVGKKLSFANNYR